MIVYFDGVEDDELVIQRFAECGMITDYRYLSKEAATTLLKERYKDMEWNALSHYILRELCPPRSALNPKIQTTELVIVKDQIIAHLLIKIFALQYVVQSNRLNVNSKLLEDMPHVYVMTDNTRIYSAVNHEELAFLTLGKMIITRGVVRNDRTMTGTTSLFGHRLQFDLSNGTFPLITSRTMYFKGIVSELLFFISGKTDTKILEQQGVTIWKKNTSRVFLDRNGLAHLPVGDMGPSYGFLMRYFGAKYVDCTVDYTGQGYDQLMEVINLITHNPTSRRIIISLWDPTNLDKCPLPPCLYNYQFYVSDGCLDCAMTQRSSDYAVAGGWNVATGALLTILIASVTGLLPRTLVWNIGDVHIYNNLLADFKRQVELTPYVWPKIAINRKSDILQYTADDMYLINYHSHPAIKYQMAV